MIRAVTVPTREIGVLGTLTVSGRYAVEGIVTGDCHVTAGSVLHLTGTVVGNLFVEPDGLALVDGCVGGDVIVHGDADIGGSVLGDVVDPDRTAVIRPGAVVRGCALH